MGTPVALPSGMVTFVFTDIEGSTRLFRRIGDRYVGLLERHHELLRAAWCSHGGAEVKTEGDAFFVAFADATDAIEACAQGQHDLTNEPWPADAMVRVRMGVHTGLAFPRGDDYIAFAVHQAARVVNAGHGGQILVSGDAAARAGNLEGVELHLLGQFQVRDFDEPVALYQVTGEGLPTGFGPLRVLPADRHNLVAPITSIIGRAHDLDHLAGRVAGARLVSVVGPGGLGKTRLAVEYGLAHAGEFEHGVWFVDLSPLTDATAIAEAVAVAVAAPIGPGVDVWTAVIDHLRDRDAVVIMDNCEHLGIEVVRRVDALLHGCTRLRVLATSREPLGLRGEVVWRPLALPVETSAVELFCSRAGLGDPDPATRAAVVELCQRLDGLPLAIELAAARSDVLAPADIVARLDAQRGLPASLDPTLDPRQRNLDDLIDWSYRLLTSDEQIALRRLGVFAAGFDLEAATATIADERLDPYDVPDLVWSLLSKSLLTNDVGAGSTRYRMLATVRSYARRLGARHDELVRAAYRLAVHYLESYGPEIDKLDHVLVSDRALELDNLRGLVPLLASDDPAVAQLLAVTIVHAMKPSSPREALESGLRYADELADFTPNFAALLVEVCAVAIENGQPDLGAGLLDRAAPIMATGSPPDWVDGRLDQQRGVIAILAGDPNGAAAIARDGLNRARTPRGRCYLLNLSGIAAFEVGDHETARWAFEEALTIDQARGSLVSAATQLCNLAELDLRSGRLQEAAEWQLHGLDLALALGLLRELISAWIVAANLAGMRHDWPTATRLQSAADTVMTRIGQFLYPTDRALCDDLLSLAAENLGRSRYETELAAGTRLSVEDTIVEARSILAAVASADPEPWPQ